MIEGITKMSVKFASANKRQGPAGSNWRGKEAQRMCGYKKNVLSSINPRKRTFLILESINSQSLFLNR